MRALKRIQSTLTVRRQAERVLARVALVRVDEAVLDVAATLDPAELRSLDAVLLATALGIGENLTGLVTYDSRLQDAARQAGLPVLVLV